MTVKLTWSIGQDKAGSGSLERSPHKGYFYWTENAQLTKTAEFSLSELEQEITRLLAEGQDVTEFRAALRRLQQL